MKFILVDQLLSHDPGKRLVMSKNVTMAEEYLADHFPGFPVLPGVMMLEAAIQTAAWVVRHHLNFAHSLIVLKEARGVRYGSFVSPGQTLIMTADAVEITATRSDFKIKGTLGGAGGGATPSRPASNSPTSISPPPTPPWPRSTRPPSSPNANAGRPLWNAPPPRHLQDSPKPG